MNHIVPAFTGSLCYSELERAKQCVFSETGISGNSVGCRWSLTGIAQPLSALFFKYSLGSWVGEGIFHWKFLARPFFAQLHNVVRCHLAIFLSQQLVVWWPQQRRTGTGQKMLEVLASLLWGEQQLCDSTSKILSKLRKNPLYIKYAVPQSNDNVVTRRWRLGTGKIHLVPVSLLTTRNAGGL